MFNPAGFQAGRTTADSLGVVGVPTIHKYSTSTDTLSTVAASAYFNEAATQTNNVPPLADLVFEIGDLILVKASNDVQFLKVTAVDPDVTTSQFSEVVDDGSITLAKLAAGIAPQSITKYSAQVAEAGGSATVVLSVPGVLATDRAFAAFQASTTAVAINKVTASANTITILCSADPGASTISYSVERTAS